MTGYKNPPPQTRFKKGQSGNPKGRPKKGAVAPSETETANALTLKEARRLITVREGENIREMSTIEAVMRAQAKAAISGNAFAQRDLVNRVEKAEAQRRSEIKEQCDYWEDYCAKMRRAVASAQARGKPLPKIYPHPDDIVIDWERGVTCHGPLDGQEAAELDRILRTRDLFFMQSELDERSFAKCDSKDPLSTISSANVLALLIDGAVPKRLRLSDSAFISRKMNYMCMTKRMLLKELYRGWRSIGMPVRRGMRMPSACIFKQVM